MIVYHGSDQLAFITQKAVDRMLSFKYADEV